MNANRRHTETGVMPVVLGVSAILFADAELLVGDDGTVAVDVLLDEIIKETAALAYKSLKSTFSCMIFVI